jgi:uncharacterized membrane protein
LEPDVIMRLRGTDQEQDSPRLAHFALYGIVAGLIVFGVVSLVTWLLYGSPIVVDHAVSSTVLVALMVLAGLLANPVLTWLRGASTAMAWHSEGRETSSPSEMETRPDVTYAASNAPTAQQQRPLCQDKSRQR